MNTTFFKYQGTGNDFILIDDRDSFFDSENTQLIAKLCDRKFGIGADGLILLQLNDEVGYYMKYYNADGNESSLCGNGGRCFAAFAAQLGVVIEKTKFMAIDGVHDAIIGQLEKNSRFVKLKMNSVKEIENPLYNTFILNTGSPHYVHFTDENLHELDLLSAAKKIRYNDIYASKGINVNFVSVTGDTSITIRTYERGVEDETLSCGTGVTAAALTLALSKKLPSDHYIISIKTLGGDLRVSYDFDAMENSFTNIWLQGPATYVYKGVIEY